MAYDFPASPSTGQVYQGWTWDGEKWVSTAANIAAPLRGWIAGLTLSAAGASATFGIAAGEAANSTNVVLMALASAYTKTTGAWAVGSGVGALDTGAIAAAAWYHVFLIRRPDTGVVDVLVSLSATAPTLPASYTQFRRIGSMLTAASQWVSFVQNGDTFLWNAVAADAAPTVLTAVTNKIVTLTVPTGVSVSALIRILGSNSTVPSNFLVSSPLTATQMVNTPPANLSVASYSTASAATDLRVFTNTSAQVNASASAATGTNNLYINTYGWSDTRGRDG